MICDINIGCDIVDNNRIKTLYKKFGDRFVERILHPQEQQKEVTIKILAKRFAAKEAISKALGTGIGESLSFQDIIITHELSGKPIVEIANLPNVRVKLSISDEKHYTLAYAIAINYGE